MTPEPELNCVVAMLLLQRLEAFESWISVAKKHPAIEFPPIQRTTTNEIKQIIFEKVKEKTKRKKEERRTHRRSLEIHPANIFRLIPQSKPSS